GAPQGRPQRATEYSAPSSACLVRLGKFCEAPLSQLDHPTGKGLLGDVEIISRQGGAIEFRPSLSQKAARLAGADAECARQQAWQVHLPVLADIPGQVDLGDVVGDRVSDEDLVEGRLGLRPLARAVEAVDDPPAELPLRLVGRSV